MTVAGDSAVKKGSMCTGYGALDAAIEALLGGELAWVADNDPAVAKLLDVRFAGVPNLGDITTTDWSNVEAVEVLTAGYPCQPFSEAGKGLGANDPRHIWPHVLDAIRHLRPRLVFLENVKGHLRNGFPQVLADLAEVGFDAEWTVLRAADVGACHARARVFVVAYPNGVGREPWTGLRRCDTPEDWWRLSRHRRSETAADTASQRIANKSHGGDSTPLTLWSIAGTGDRVDVGDRAAGVVDDRRSAGVMAWAAYEPAIRRHERLIGRPAPHPHHDGKLSPAFVEWMQATPEGWVTDVLGRDQSLRLLGNGVVIPCAIAANDYLLNRVMEAQANAA